MNDSIDFKPIKFGCLEVLACSYELRGDVSSMPHFRTAYLHNTYKHRTPEAILQYHRSLGWSGIGYHFAIGPEGTIFNTRSIDLQGAQVYGRNSESIGIVLLDIDACADSLQAIESFRRLYTELCHVAGEPALSVLPHTYGQFEYLNDIIAAYNDDLRGKQFPLVHFDDSVHRLDVYAKKRAEVIDAIMQHRRKVPQEKQEAFRRLVSFADKLKICPGNKYAAFATAVGRD